MPKNFIGVLSILLLLCCGRCNFLDLSTFVKPILDPHAYKADRNNLFQEFKIFDQRRNNNLRTQDKVQDTLYKTIGIPDLIITLYVIPIHVRARNQLNNYFKKRSITPRTLHRHIKNLKNMIQWILANYLKNISKIIIGDNNSARGQDIYIQGNNHQVTGSHNFIFDSKDKGRVLKGDNIVRIDQYDIDLDFVDKVATKPQQAITYYPG